MKRLSVIFSELDAKQRSQVKILLKQNGYALEDFGITSKRSILQKVSVGNIDAIVVGNSGSSNKQFLPGDVMGVRRDFPEIRIIYILNTRQDYSLDMLYQLYEKKIYNILFQSDSISENIAGLLIRDRESKDALHYLGLDTESVYLAPISDQVISSLNHFIKSGVNTEDMRHRFHTKMAIYDDRHQKYYCEQLTDPVLLEALKQDTLYRKYIPAETEELPKKGIFAKRFGIRRQSGGHSVTVEQGNPSVPERKEDTVIRQPVENGSSYSLLSSNSVLWEMEKSGDTSSYEGEASETVEVQAEAYREEVPNDFNGLIADLTDPAKEEITGGEEEEQQSEDPFLAYMNRKKEQAEAEEEKRKQEEQLAAEEERKREERQAIEEKRKQEEQLAAEEKRKQEEQFAIKERQLQEERLAIEEKRKQEEQFAAEEKRKLEEQRVIEEKRLQEERLAIEEQKKETFKQQEAEKERLKAIRQQQEAEQTRIEKENQRLQEQRRIQEEKVQKENQQIALERRRLEEEQKKWIEKQKKEEQSAKERRQLEKEQEKKESEKKEQQHISEKKQFLNRKSVLLKPLVVSVSVCVFGGVLFLGLAAGMKQNPEGGETAVFSRPAGMSEYRVVFATEEESSVEEIIEADTEEIPEETETVAEVPASTAQLGGSNLTGSSSRDTTQTTEAPVSTTETIPPPTTTEAPIVAGIERYDGAILTGREVVNFIYSYGGSYGILVESRSDGILAYGTYGSDSTDRINQGASYYASVTYVNGAAVAIRFTQG